MRVLVKVHYDGAMFNSRLGKGQKKEKEKVIEKGRGRKQKIMNGFASDHAVSQLVHGPQLARTSIFTKKGANCQKITDKKLKTD